MEEKTVEILRSVNEEILTYTGTNMMADGIIDSFELISIIGQLEDEFGIEINANDVTVENFANKESIIKLLSKLLA